MASYHAPGAAPAADGNASNAPLVVLFERDDAIAVPLLSQLRMAGYDVRAARTPVDLFDLLGKQLVSLVLVDLGAATAGRREFWVALDAQRRGRALQVMTFRQISPAHPLDAEGDPSARALADVEVAGPQDFQKIIQGVRQRIPLHGGQGGMLTGLPLPGGAAQMAQNPFATAAPSFDPYQMPPAAPPFLPPTYGPPPTYGQPQPYPSQFSSQYPSQGPSAFPGGQPMPGQMPFGGPSALPGQMPAQPPMPYATQGPAYPNQMPYPDQPPPYPSQAQPYAADPYAMPGHAPGGAPPWDPSPFANPAGANPFITGGPSGPSGGGAASPFAQPYTANPFGGDAVPGGPAPFEPQPPSAHVAPPWGAPSPAPASPGGSPFSAPAPVNPFASPSSSPAQPASPFGFGDRSGFYNPNGGGTAQGGASHFGGSGPLDPPAAPSSANISDTWIPPDEDAAVQTGIVPEVAYHAGQPLFSERAGLEWGTTPSYNPNEAEWGGAPSPGDWNQPAPAAPMPPVPSPTRNLPVVQSPADQALGTVLVEGALLTPSKLEVLRGVQAMLSSVRMEYKLGELALLFRFLSPDQLLAALLVSRGLVTPQQIAGLGRVKQELAASGMDHDLESLLMMFHILSPDQLRQIRAELS